MAAREGGAPCGACKFLRRKCVKGCVFAPYFSTEELGAAHFAAIHKIFGASNFSKLLHNIPSEQERFDAVVSISYEAQARLQDPIYGCVSHISALQQKVAHLEAELSIAHSRLVASSDRTSLRPSPHAEISTSSYSRPYEDHYYSSSEPQSSHQSASENVAFYFEVKTDKNLCFSTNMDYCEDLSVGHHTNAFEDEIKSLQASQVDGGDLHALAFNILRSRS
ncbi:LOB domain-containing protein 29-like [Cryptomeria japonica]|uniref:LOB domain-containing protein 29-like n=1 Tax=Cryptomeria japonica TaxID=3369 RepID=UPI0027DA455F|nr:LOB domain-containing protein 29-like [Cryptomeria japonica]